MKDKTKSPEDKAEILAVDDSATQAEQLRYILEQQGYPVTLATNGEQALALLNEHQPTLVISDIVMPEMNGYELCQRIKGDKRFRDIPVILLTSLSNAEDVLEALACGADSFVTKPYNTDYLLAHIQQILANWKLRNTDRVRVGVEILIKGQRRFISADQQQMLGLLLSTYEAAVQRNTELTRTQDELSDLNEHLEDLVDERTAALSAEIAERKRAEEALHDKVVALQLLADIDQAIISSLDLDQVLVTLLDKVREAAMAEACSVALIDQASGDLVFRQAVGGAAQKMIDLRLRPGEGLGGWVVQHRQSVLIPDAAADARVHILDGGNGFVTRDLIVAPLIARDQVMGVIELVNKRNGKFTEDDRRLLEAVAAQAVIAIENARLFEIERAGRERLQILYRTGQAINSSLDVDSILDRLTDEAMRATHATHGSALVAQPDQGRFERRSLRGYTSEQAEQARADGLPLDRGINGRAYYSRQPVYVVDVQIDPDYHPLIPGTRSELAVPILRGGQVIGNLDLQSSEVDAFRDANLDFLQALTDQVAIALENARHLAETRRHATEMSIVSEVALVGAAGRPFDETVARATNALTQLWPEASLGFLFVDEAAQVLNPHRSYYGMQPELLSTLSISTSQGIIGRSVRERQPVRVGNVKTDPHYIVIAPDTQSVMAAPLVAGGRVIGVVNVDSPRLDAFSGDDLRLLTTLAGQLATIFEKARLDAELIQHAAILEQRVQERTAELATANARLTELDQLKSKFVSDVSHELRTPITALSLNVDLLEHGKPEKREKYMQAIRQQVQREAQLIEDILNLSRLELGADKVQFAPVALNSLIAQIVAVHQPAVDAKNVTLTFTPNSDLPVVRGEENQLAQVITNLIGNAVNYTLTGGITVSAVPTEDHVVIEVRDTGLGIAPEDVPHLFERFYRGGRTRNIRGTGLGLAIAQEIVDLHGGTIDVDSQVGVGTTVTVTLPLGISSGA